MQLVPHGNDCINCEKEQLLKPHCQKQPQGLFIVKNVRRIQLQLHRRNAQQVAFTPIKFGNQSY